MRKLKPGTEAIIGPDVVQSLGWVREGSRAHGLLVKVVRHGRDSAGVYTEICSCGTHAKVHPDSLQPLVSG